MVGTIGGDDTIIAPDAKVAEKLARRIRGYFSINMYLEGALLQPCRNNWGWASARGVARFTQHRLPWLHHQNDSTLRHG